VKERIRRLDGNGNADNKPLRLVVAALILRDQPLHDQPLRDQPDSPEQAAENLASEIGRDFSPGTTAAEPTRALAPGIGSPQGSVREPGLLAPPETATEVLICQRRPDQPMSLKWEFPGGKIEPGETAEQALARELEEELGIAAVIGPRIAQIRHRYRNGGAIDLQFFTVKQFTGELSNRIFNAMQWAPLITLPTFDFLAADLGLIRDLSQGKLL
jgi:8-oxo-dGTP diphosphatase